MSNQPPPDDRPEPPPPVTPDGTSAPAPGQRWSTPSGDFPTPEAYQPGYATPPPIDYAPPGSGTPDYGYGQPGYSPPMYYPPPSDPAPRKSNTPLIAVIIAVALLLCGGVATAGVLITRAATQKARDLAKPLTEPTLPTLPTDLPTGVGGRQLSVTYEVTGDSPAQIFYLVELGKAPTQLKSVSLPWQVTKTIATPALVSVTAVRLTGAAGEISCRTVVDGKEVAKKTNYSTYGTVSCNWFVLE